MTSSLLRSNHLSRPVATLPNAVQDDLGPLCHKCTLLAYGPLGVCEDPQVLFCKHASQLVSPQHVLVLGVVLPQMQDFALPLVELHEVSCQPISAASSSGWQYNPLVYQPVLPVLHYQQTR